MADLTETIRRMAHLARLDFPEAELARYTAKAKAVLAYVEKLGELNTEGVEPTSHANAAGGGALRPDTVFAWENPEHIVEAAPQRDGAFVQVPRVIE